MSSDAVRSPADGLAHHPLVGRPGKVIAVHLNYPSRIAQRGRVPSKPSYFLKPVTSLAVTGESVERPAGAELLAFEGEIALVVGRTARRVSKQDGWTYVSAVTAANDLGLYDLRAADKGSNLRSKGGDGYTPLGPDLIPAAEIDPTNLRVRTWVGDQQVQDDSAGTVVFPFGELVADLSQLITLEPGDVVLTGTPAGASVVEPGDVVEVEVDVPGTDYTTGRLRTTVVEGTERLPEFSAQPAVDDHQRAEAWGSGEAAGLPAPFELTDEIRAKLQKVAVATLSAQLRKHGYNQLSIDGVRTNKPGNKLIGRARTLRFVPAREDLFRNHGGGYNAQKRTFDSLESGDVLVVEARGERGSGTVGDILALRAQVLGAAGIVTDGGVRDYTTVADLQIPTFSNGPHPAVLGRKHVPWDSDITVACGGATVQPGDVIVGDDDGVLVIPPELLDDVLDAALEQEAEEEWIAARVAEGAAVDGLYPLTGEWRRRYEAERTGQEGTQ
ncbi:2-keto-4-pentenoate hydratase/2-oxohepta-3-ene-1,7-dioic acid hydratase in catechol pathway/regulator of RNase E activity RraA [Prauserella sediminis]|uniref:2-keto-4-pentenoate hydratase/2-oxohepta-3-ene-1,7-dioic acid hydratase in catechol pathway/regulator of RNase E activity RraA n=1 Tax=Prauserella sediminis TaxID=577680 RepID=A0A839XMR9_9PSEU|nr:fumarylacetoacetate hydrolase family protein [Prauserella sediminis]MBB3664560.1 2-keto-4-pentenoate hydratase/2-oxohepta-3-ene-1,7-dioic acid hydratase in catechol pathway/regulator of RNase E activity RraA [Prauserella sediminis]